jgi:hypothetical protein
VDRVRIGNGCGFWGDNLDAPVLLARNGRLDYLTLEYLAELTMSILALQKQRDPQAGFAGDFLDVLDRLGPILREQPGLARSIMDQAGLSDRVIATVTGDDLLPRLDELLASGHSLAHLDTGEPLTAIRGRVVSANAYLGAGPIAEALGRGASVVITGRVADASLTVGPAVHELGWSWDHWDHLAAATVAGHLIECGAQVTGGLWCNWPEAPALADVGYPIAVLERDGPFTITKASSTGGTVNCETVSEQLLYEVGDPASYLTPDVVADFTAAQLAQTGRDEVRVTGFRGQPAPDCLKVSIAYRDGFTASGTLVLLGPYAAEKGRLSGAMILDRLRRAGFEPERHNVECLGAGDCVPGVLPAATAPPEVVLRVTIRDSRRSVVERFTKEFAPLVTSGPPGVTGYTTGRPPVREVFAYWPALIDRRAVSPVVEIVQNPKSKVQSPALSPSRPESGL